MLSPVALPRQRSSSSESNGQRRQSTAQLKTNMVAPPNNSACGSLLNQLICNTIRVCACTLYPRGFCPPWRERAVNGCRRQHSKDKQMAQLHCLSYLAERPIQSVVGESAQLCIFERESHSCPHHITTNNKNVRISRLVFTSAPPGQ